MTLDTTRRIDALIEAARRQWWEVTDKSDERSRTVELVLRGEGGSSYYDIMIFDGKLRQARSSYYGRANSGRREGKTIDLCHKVSLAAIERHLDVPFAKSCIRAPR